MINVNPDPFLTENIDQPVFGLNLALCWPFPLKTRKAYEQIAREIKLLGPEVYVYPYHQTHITLMTIIDFKKYLNPRKDKIIAFKEIAAELYELLIPIVQTTSQFKISLDSLELSQNAGFLQSQEPRKSVVKLRAAIENALIESELSIIPKIPNIVHSTILRFKSVPSNPSNFLFDFNSIKRNSKIAEILISELLITSETKPYMRDGEILYRISLKE